jgi:hypothetical protein
MSRHRIEASVIHVDVGPGCWGLIEASGKQWRPLNMPEQLKNQDKKVEVVIEEVEETFDVFMWGTPARIISFHT